VQAYLIEAPIMLANLKLNLAIIQVPYQDLGLPIQLLYLDLQQLAKRLLLQELDCCLDFMDL